MALVVIVGTTGCSITCHGPNLVVIGGWNPNYTDDLLMPRSQSDPHYVRKIYRYNMYSDIWVSLPCYEGDSGCPVETASHCAFSMSPDTVLFLGGSFSSVSRFESSNSLYKYSTESGSWEKLECSMEKAPPTELGHWFGRAAFLGDDGILTVASGNQIIMEMLIHQIDLKRPQLEWEELLVTDQRAKLREALLRHSIVVYDRNVFLFGGSFEFLEHSFMGNGQAALSLGALPTFDLVERKWTVTHFAGPEEIVSLWPFATSSVLIDNFVFLTGGKVRTLEGRVELLNDVLRLDLKEKRWNVFAKLPGGGRFFHASCATCDGRLCVFGGCTDVSYYGERTSELAFVQCTVGSLQHLALRALFAAGVGQRLAVRLRESENSEDAIAKLHSEGIPPFVVRLLL